MAALTISDPYDLKPADAYRQASTVASKTSRASDANWYKNSSEIAFQWHLWFDGGREVCSATFSRPEGRWRQGPPLPLANLTTAEGMSEVLGDLLSAKYFGVRPKALGVILHSADEFALTEVAPSGDSVADANEEYGLIRYNLVDSPKETLADREISVETTSWRLLPFWGAPAGQQKAVAMALPRHREAFLNRLVESGEQWRVPVRVSVTCAPAEALAAMTVLLPELTGGCIVILPYLKYTAVFALTPKGELRSARSLGHRGNNTVPVSFGDILWNIAVGAELVIAGEKGPMPPRVVIVSANPAALEDVAKELESYSQSRQPLNCEKVDLKALAATEAIPGHRPEFLLYDPKMVQAVAGGHTNLSKSETFKSLWDGWASQNFFNTAKLDALYPSLADLRLLKFSTWLVYFLAFLLIGVGGYTTFALFAAMNHPSWHLTPEQVKLTEANHQKLITEERQIDVTQRLLQPRSQGWANVELLLQLFPEESGVRLESYSYILNPAAPAGPRQPAAPKDAVGLEKEWTFKGLAKSKGLDLLNNLNSQRGLNAFFNSVAEATQDTSFAPSGERQYRITLTQNRNPRFTASASAADVAREPSLSFPYTFEASIYQTLSEKDPLALPVAKPF
ncbi:MAG: hypothetical protein ACAI34_02240 [Verrucomicrobium sp.]|nr:hypothetical protein [Verrucomicrobium sp.]